MRMDLLCRDFSVSSLKRRLVRKGKLLSRRKCLLENTGRDIPSQPGSCEPGNETFIVQTSLTATSGLLKEQLGFPEARDILRYHR